MSDMMRILCPRCRTINRVPAARLADGPNCGQCHEPLFTGYPIALTASDFDAHATRSDLPLVVDFWAPWCGPCRMMAPAYEQAAKALEPLARLAKVSTEEEQALGARFGIQSIPTMIVFSGGREVARQSGALSAQDIVRWVRSCV
jgi:thioredoxin 2